MNAQSQTKEPPKKAYAPPRLVNFGNVRLITQAGTAGPSEGSMPAAAEMTMSDRRTKENIVRVGSHPFGFGLYLFDYKPEHRERCGHDRQFGVMAQEVESVMPEAVFVRSDGYRMVNYAMLGINRNLDIH